MNEVHGIQPSRLSFKLPTVFLVATVLAVGCGGTELIPTPNLFRGVETEPFAEVPEALRTSTASVLYVTDRQPVEEDGVLSYDHKRSYSVAFGSADVTFGEDVSWEELVEASQSAERSVSLPVKVHNVNEMGRFPDTPHPTVPGDDGFPTPDPAVQEEVRRLGGVFRAELRRRLAMTPAKDVYVYIHGYNNAFDDAVAVVSELWHFIGRQGVPIAYTWPAGRGGLRGYFYDRESGEFTVYHLKEFLKLLASIDEIERIHVVAHSRGTDVTLTALRELYLELKDKLRPREERKLANVILAAPDLDVDVISQRIVAEEFVKHLGRLTVYMSTTDVALGFSTWLFVSQKRIGRISIDELPPALKRRTANNNPGAVALIDARVTTGFVGHSYFYSHPAVLSDLVLILRDNRHPGAEHGRPLAELGPSYWRIDDDYPRLTPVESEGSE